MFALWRLKMSDESVMALVLAGFAGAICAWACYNYNVRQKQKSMTADEIFKSWSEFTKEEVKPKPALKKATTRNVWPKDFDAKDVLKALDEQAPKPKKEKKVATKPGLYANIHKKQERIKKEKAEGKPVEKMRKPGTKGAPTAKAFEQSAKTAKKK